jgi:hypothetical protein
MKQYIIRISVSHSWFGRGEAELLSAPALLPGARHLVRTALFKEGGQWKTMSCLLLP